MNLHIENLDLNYIISTSSPNGNPEKRKKRLANVSSESIVHQVSGALTTYYLEGPRKCFEYIESAYKGKSSKKEEKWFFYSFVSLVVGNLDDYSYYSKKLDQNSFFKLRLEIKEITLQYNPKKEVQKHMVEKIDQFLQDNQVSDSQAVFLKLCKVYFEDDIAGYSGDYDEYTPVVSLWQENPDMFDRDQLLRYLDNCQTPECEKASQEIKNKDFKEGKELVTTFNLISVRGRKNGVELESQLKEIIVNTPQGIQREKLKSMILACDEEYRFAKTWKKDLKGIYFNPSRLKLVLSDAFKADLLSKMSKEDLLKEVKKIADDSGIQYDKTSWEILSQDQAQIVLGGILMISTLASQTVYPAGPYYEVQSKSVSKEYRGDWNAFVKYVEKDPLYNNAWDNTSYNIKPKLETKEDREAAVRAFEPLVKKYPNSLNMIRWKFWLLFQDENLYEFDAKNCELYMKTLIKMFALNQSEGRPGEKNKEFSFYVRGRNLPAFTYKDKDFLPEIKKRLGSEKWSVVVKYLEDQMTAYPRNANLRAVHLKLIKVNEDANLYFESFVEGAKTIRKMPTYDIRFAGDIRSEKAKKLLLDSYKSTKNLENHGELVPIYHQFELFQEAAIVMSSYIQDIPWEPNKEKFFMKFSDIPMRQKLLETVLKSNEEVGIISLYLMMYDLVLGNEEKAQSRLEKLSSIYVIYDYNLNAAFDLPKDSEMVSRIKDKMKEKYPKFFEQERW
jgi:hypothetical protein